MEIAIEALTTGVAISFFIMVFSGLAAIWTYFAAVAVVSGQFVGLVGLFAASTLLTFGLPSVVEQLEEYETARMAKKVEA